MKTVNALLLVTAAAVVVSTLVISPRVQAHCQVPCGIYDDHARVQAMLEDATTVAKAAKMMAELTGKTDPQSVNQSVRWVMNKEEHAQNVIDTISDYFLTQRVKPSQADYEARLVKHHTVIIAAMKAKQNADVSFAIALHESIAALAAYYPEHQN